MFYLLHDNLEIHKKEKKKEKKVQCVTRVTAKGDDFYASRQLSRAHMQSCRVSPIESVLILLLVSQRETQ